MSDRVKSRQRGGPASEQRMTKAEKRAAAKAAAARAAEARRRRQALTGALAGLAVIAVLIAVVVVLNRAGRPDAAPGTPAAGATAAPSGAPADPAFPPLPEGADPALAQKPTTGAGTVELTKLTVTPLVEGKGPAAQTNQRITVNYVGVSYKTGEEFDASWDRAEPFSFQLGGGQVIPGWDRGLVGVKVGSRVQLDIPADLAYGDNPDGGRPGGPLRFVVDVLAVG